jgi:hypothetical protein
MEQEELLHETLERCNEACNFLATQAWQRRLIGLRDWLTANKCTHVAMEATGVYGKPMWHILADGEFVLANAAHVKNLPGRKTDVSDAEFDALEAAIAPPSNS